MFKNFKKSPENPFNQATVAFDASKEEKLAALKKLREETENRCVNFHSIVIEVSKSCI